MRLVAAATLGAVLLSSPVQAVDTSSTTLSASDLERALVLTDIERRRCEATLDVVTSTTSSPESASMPWWGWTLTVVAGVALGVAGYLGTDRLIDEASR